jgi:hypothetical protein
MGSGFHIIVRGSVRHVQMTLIGGLDEAGARCLLEQVNSCMEGAERMTVCTNCLEKVEPQAAETLAKGLARMGPRRCNVLFTGQNAEKVAPGQTVFYF